MIFNLSRHTHYNLRLFKLGLFTYFIYLTARQILMSYLNPTFFQLFGLVFGYVYLFNGTANSYELTKPPKFFQLFGLVFGYVYLFNGTANSYELAKPQFFFSCLV